MFARIGVTDGSHEQKATGLIRQLPEPPTRDHGPFRSCNCRCRAEHDVAVPSEGRGRMDGWIPRER